MGDCFASLAMTYEVVLSSDFAFGLMGQVRIAGRSQSDGCAGVLAIRIVPASPTIAA
jgi:hypothetical protein